MNDRDERAIAVGLRLRHHRKEAGLSQPELAARVNAYEASLSAKSLTAKSLSTQEPVTGDMIRKWESGHVKLYRHPHRVEALSQVLGISPSELLEGTQPTEPDSRKMRRLPVLGDLAAGPPEGANGVMEWLDVEDWGNTNERWGRRIRGVSMEPGLVQGDLCIFEDRRAEIGEIVHAWHPDQGVDTIKVYRGGSDGHPVLSPMNEDCETIDEDGWQIKGTLVEARLKFGSLTLIVKDDWAMPLRPKHLLMVRTK